MSKDEAAIKLARLVIQYEEFRSDRGDEWYLSMWYMQRCNEFEREIAICKAAMK